MSVGGLQHVGADWPSHHFSWTPFMLGPAGMAERGAYLGCDVLLVLPQLPSSGSWCRAGRREPGACLSGPLSVSAFRSLQG